MEINVPPPARSAQSPHTPMIPHTIHYCWFGGRPLPESARKCIASWRKFLPDYEIREWNEQTFDVNLIPYTREAYAAGKYAFVSDYARFWILYHHGGLYFDTDVELIRPLDDILARGAFMGREAGACISAICDASMLEASAARQGGADLGVNPGLGLGVAPGRGLYREMLDLYAALRFRREDGTLNQKTIVAYTTEVLLRHGLSGDNDRPQHVAGVWVYPPDVFCPMDHTQANRLTLTPRTVSIHHYDCSWLDHRTFSFRLHLLKNWLARRFGVERVERIAQLIRSKK